MTLSPAATATTRSTVTAATTACTASSGADELRGGSGNDTADYFDGSQAVMVDLASGTGLGGEADGDRLSGIENLFGTSYNDRLAGNAAANRLAGLDGADVLAGRGGADRFGYGQTSDSLPAAPDRILDFSRSQGDRIDLVEVDANAQVTGDQAFKFIGQAQFTAPGQLRFFQQNGDTIVEANTTDATAGAEMRIVLDPLVSLQASDFLPVAGRRRWAREMRRRTRWKGSASVTERLGRAAPVA